MSCNLIKGGDYKHAEAVYGNMNNQHKGADGAIAVKQAGGRNKKGGMVEQMLVPLTLVAANTLIPKRRKSQKGGGSELSALQPAKVCGGKMLQEIAVPLALVVANNTLKKRSSYNNKYNKYKKSKKNYRKSRFTRRK
jgi:hypothetical protein